MLINVHIIFTVKHQHVGILDTFNNFENYDWTNDLVKPVSIEKNNSWYKRWKSSTAISNVLQLHTQVWGFRSELVSMSIELN